MRVFGIVVLVLVADAFFFSTQGTWSVMGLIVYAVWLAVFTVVTAYTRLVWANSKQIDAIDGIKVRLLGSLLVCSVAPVLVYLTNRSPVPTYLGDFENKILTYVCLVAQIVVMLAAYFGVESQKEEFAGGIAKHMIV